MDIWQLWRLFRQKRRLASRNLRLFGGAAIIFYLIAALNDAPAVYVLAAACLAVIIGCYTLSRLAVGGLDIEIQLPQHEAVAGSPFSIRIVLRNNGRISRPEAHVRLSLCNHTILGLNHTSYIVLPETAAGQVVEAMLEIVLPARGRWQIGPATIIGTDPLGMFQRPGATADPQFVLALPQTFQIPPAWRQWLLAPAVRLKGALRARQGQEFWGIRPHEPGDELRHVHWKATARQGTLVVKEYAQGQEMIAALWIDTSHASLVGEGLDSSFELSIQLAASLARSLMEMEQAVAVLGEGLPASIALPGRGQAVLRRILQALAEAQPKDGSGLQAMKAAWSHGTPQGLTRIVITSGMQANLEPVLASVAHHGMALRCFLVAPETQLSAEQRQRQERLAALLRKRGIPVAVGGDLRRLVISFRPSLHYETRGGASQL